MAFKLLQVLVRVLSIIYSYKILVSIMDFPEMIGPYPILKKLGQGSFSEVYLTGTEPALALKCLKNNLPEHDHQISAFKNEFQLLKNLNHPNITRILDFGHDKNLFHFYFTTEYIAGQTIFQATANRDMDFILNLFVQCLRALNYLHAHHITHFDIKADNVLVTNAQEPQIKIIDFGLANFSFKGTLMGTPSYMAPEIIERRQPDQRADIYSLGVLFYYCLTRQNPFAEKKIGDTLKKQLHHQALSPSKIDKKIPSFLDEIVLKMLSKSPQHRQHSAGEILRDFKLYLKLPEIETRETLLSYLPEEGELIGRKTQWQNWLKIFSDFTSDRQIRVLHICGETGTGKTRFVNEMRYDAEVKGLEVLVVPTTNLAEFSTRLSRKSSPHPKLILIDSLEAVANFHGEGRLVTMLAKLLCEAPALIVTTSSQPKPPEDFLNLDARAQLIRLENFSTTELEEYLSRVVGSPHLPKKLLEGIRQRTQGNPLLVTEILRALILGGGLFDSHGRLSSSTLDEIGIDFDKARSEKLKILFEEQIKKLSPRQQELLNIFATARETLNMAQIVELVNNEDVSGDLAVLLKLEFVIRQGAGFCLRHDTLAAFVQEDLAPQKRRAFHERLAKVCEKDETRAWHLINGSNKKLILETLDLWGEKYLKMADPRATSFYESALANLEKLPESCDPGTIIKIKLKLAEALLMWHRGTEALALLETLHPLIQKLPPGIQQRDIEIDFLIRQGCTLQKTGESEPAFECFEKAISLADQKPLNISKKLVAQNLRAALFLEQGQSKKAADIFTESKKIWEELAPEEQKLVSNNDLGMVYLAEQKFDAAILEFKNQLKFVSQIQDGLLTCRSHYNLALAHLGLTQNDEAVIHFEKAIHHAKAIRNLEILFRAYNGLGNIFRECDPQRALKDYEHALELAEVREDLSGILAIRLNIALVLSQTNTGKSLSAITQLIRYLRQKNKTEFDWMILCRAELEWAELLRRGKKFSEALVQIHKAREISELHQNAFLFWILMAHVDLFLDTGDPQKAQSLLDEARPHIQNPEEQREFDTRLKKIQQVESLPKPDDTLTEDPHEPFAHLTEDMNMNPYKYILKINKFINTETDLNFVLKTVLSHAIEICRAESGAILLLDENDELKMKAHLNLSKPEEVGAFSQSIARQAIESGQWLSTHDALHDQRFENEASIVGLNLKSVLCLPIRSKNKTVGALYLENRHRARAFEELDIEVLEAFCDQVGIAIENATRFENLQNKISHIRDGIPNAGSSKNRYSKDGLIGHSEPMLRVFALMDKIADTDLSVYIHGPSGTGKELVARAHHEHSARQGHKFVSINCGAIPANLIESELFGHKAGAFTGATRDKAGLIEEAHGGTLFLDEIGELELGVQVKLLRVLQEQEFRRLGATQSLKVNVRVISASNRDLEKMLGEGKFREDLFYRLCQIRLDLPPLKERREDIPEIVTHILRKHKPDQELSLSPSLMKIFFDYDWPGNIRELENLLRVATALAGGKVIDENALPPHHPLGRKISTFPKAGQNPVAMINRAPAISIDAHNIYDPAKSWYDYEKIITAKSFEKNGFKTKETARELGIPLPTLFKKIKNWNLRDRDNPVWQESFHHTTGKNLKSYQKEIFSAATKSSGDKVYQAIASLKVSPGYFYKVIKA